MPRRFFKTAHQKVAEFREGRTRQSDEEFLRESDLPDDPDTERVALAVRRAVANVGSVDPAYIRADDRHEVELESLPLWDSMDWLDLLLELESELGMEIPDREAERIRVASGFSVERYVHDTLTVMQRLRSQDQAR